MKNHEKKKAKGEKPNKLSVSTQILLMLEYYREYRSMAHMAFDFRIGDIICALINFDRGFAIV
jgi:hypothetical protein